MAVLVTTWLLWRFTGDSVATRLMVLPACIAGLAFIVTTVTLGAGEWTEYEDTCAYVNETYPNGVALDRRVAKAQAAQGNRAPDVRPVDYEQAHALDHDQDGTACEQPESTELGQND